MTAADLLGAEGPLARSLPGFAPRPQQQAMAAAVARALRDRTVLVVEAGTGTGKTLAYLTPALLSGARVIISTGTKNLQDQLFHKDLPVVRQALAVPVKAAMLKGRSNYLCRHRLALAETGGRWRRREQAAEFGRIRAWAQRTWSGDVGDIPDVPETSPVWPQVTSTTDSCLGQECAFWSDCFVVKARRRAQEADILVINHHLFFADMAIREEGVTELLPGSDAIILDEAHQLPETASLFFGLSLSSRQLSELAQDTVAEQQRDAPDFPVLRERAARLEPAAAALRQALGQEARRAPWRTVAGQPAVIAALTQLAGVLTALGQSLKEAAPRGKGLESCSQRCGDLAQRLTKLTQPAADTDIHWFETRPQGFTLSLTPLDIAPVFHNFMTKHQGAWIFTSATLAVGESFEHFAGRLGLADPVTLRLDSPFDFTRNALLYHPPGLPEPASPHYLEAWVEAVLPVLAASQGRAFLLFTSHRALNEAAAGLNGRVPYPLLVQGSLPKGELLARFRALGNAVLLGTASFWEGVDVRGEALSCVVIDKLPFESPGDPVLQARIDALRRQGGNPFLEHQVPQAVIALKQGAGRLIRDVTDRGVLVLCDPRLLSKSYGRIFLDSLPPMPRTVRLADVQAFFAAANAGQ